MPSGSGICNTGASLWNFSQFCQPTSGLWWLKALIPSGGPHDLQVQLSVFGCWKSEEHGGVFSEHPFFTVFVGKSQNVLCRFLSDLLLSPPLSKGACFALGRGSSTCALGRILLSSPSVPQLLIHDSHVSGEETQEDLGIWLQPCSGVGLLVILIWLAGPHVWLKTFPDFSSFHLAINYGGVLFHLLFTQG